jgi:anti-sigma-K factor RskA
MNREGLLELIAAYALDALDDDERAQVEALLEHDTEAQQRLAEYRKMTEVLALAAPWQAAPDHLGADLRRRLSAEQSPARAAPKGRVFPLWWAAAAAVALFIAVGFVVMSQRNIASGADIYARLSVADDARQIALVPHLSEEIDGALWLAATEDQAVIRVRRLPALAEDQTFQLWLVDENGSKSGGLYRFERPEVWNYIVVPLEKPAGEYVRFGVSIEPRGGSPLGDRPTGERVFNVVLAADAPQS